MNYISLFSGIECASVVAKPLGWEPVCFSEIEPFPCAVLAHHYPDVPNVGDMTRHDWSAYRGNVDLVIGGSPCQAFSVAGKRQSLGDARGDVRNVPFMQVQFRQDIRLLRKDARSTGRGRSRVRTI